VYFNKYVSGENCFEQKVRQVYFRDMFKKVSKNVCTWTVVVSPDPLSPTPTSSAVKTQEKQKRTLVTWNQQMERDMQIKYFFN
jgi:hypothetical protein